MSLESEVEKMYTIAVLNDLHCPEEDKKTLKPVLRCLQDANIDEIILAGDVADFFSISKFNKLPLDEFKKNFQNELESTRKFLRELRDLFPKVPITYIKGNHEERLESFLISKAGALTFLPELEWYNLLHLDKFNIKHVDKRYMKKYGILFSHIDKYTKVPGSSPRILGQDYLCDVIHTHTHHFAKIRIGDHTFVENGCLCKPQKYEKKPTMIVQAFTLLYKDRNNKHGNKYFYESIDIKDHKFVWGGKLYK